MKQREIKFRAWTKDGMKHFDPLVLHDCGGFRNPRAYRLITYAVENVNYIHDDFGGEDYKEHVIMQYTGAKDRHGNEVYEGDVLRCEGLVIEIRWDDWELALVAISDNGKVLDLGIVQHSEIIGNIYEQ